MYYGFRQKDNNGILLSEGYAAKLEYPLKETNVQSAAEKIREIYDLYLKNTGSKVYLSIVPDKAMFLAEKNGCPAMDYEKLRQILTQGTDFARYVDIWDELSLGSYYKTDTHWRQETLLPVAEALAQAMGTTIGTDFREVITDQPFYGVYYGQSALPLKPEEIRYLTNETLDSCTVWNMETGEMTGIYNMEKLRSRDSYEVFLSGASSLLVLENPNAETERELVVFRDSFGSSLIPLLAEGYTKITLVDTRYIPAKLVGDYVNFTGQDVLFLYSTLILNNSESLR